MDRYSVLVDAVLAATLTPAVFFDLRSRRIPHWLSLSAAAAGLVLAGVFHGWGDGWLSPGLRSSLLGGAGIYALMALPVLIGWMGGGDAALIGGVGALVGFPRILGALMMISIVGGVQGVIAVAARTKPGRALCRRLGISGTDREEFARAVPYAVAIAGGTLLFFLWLNAQPSR